MSRQVRILQADLAKLESFLEHLPDPKAEAVTKREAIHRLLPQITDLRRRGYTVQAIAEQLSAQGLQVTRAVLQKYLSELKGRPLVRRSKLPRAVPEPVAAHTQSLPKPRVQAPREPRSAEAAGGLSPAASNLSSARVGSHESSTPNRIPSRPTTSAGGSFTPREDSDDL